MADQAAADVWALPFATVLDTLGHIVVEATRSFDKSARNRVLSFYDATKSLEAILGEDCCLSVEVVIPPVTASGPPSNDGLTYTQFLRVLLELTRTPSTTRETRRSERDALRPSESKSSSSNSNNKSVGVGVSVSVVHQPSHSTAADAKIAQQSSVELDVMRRTRVRKFESDRMLIDLTSATATASRPPQAESKEDKAADAVKIVEKASYPTLADDTEPALTFVMLEQWNRIAHLGILSKRNKRQHLKHFMKHDQAMILDSFYFKDADAKATSRSLSSSSCIRRSDFSLVMRDVGVYVKVSQLLAWTPCASWWQNHLDMITYTASGDVAKSLSWGEFERVLETLSRFAERQVVRFQEIIAGEIWRNVKAKAVYAAAKAIIVERDKNDALARQKRVEVRLQQRKTEADKRAAPKSSPQKASPLKSALKADEGKGADEEKKGEVAAREIKLFEDDVKKDVAPGPDDGMTKGVQELDPATLLPIENSSSPKPIKPVALPAAEKKTASGRRQDQGGPQVK